MHTVLDIDSWAREVAEAEAVALRDAVRESLKSGAGLTVTLAMIRRRMSSLTAAQREVVVEAIDRAPSA
jgi:hypothetical protein